MNTVFNPFTGNLDLIGDTPQTSGANFIVNPNAEINTASWTLYNNAGRTVPASLTNQDITFTSTLSGSGGNGVDIEYVYSAGFPAATPNINVVSSSHVQVQWNNGPTVANNPTATQLKTAWDAVPAAIAIATTAITGTASRLQYITGQMFLSNGGDAAPITGLGGSVSGVTFTRSTVNPIVGDASFFLSKDAVDRQGEGVSTDFEIDNINKGETLEVQVSYDGDSGITLGNASDVVIWIYDITNAKLIPVAPKNTLAGPNNSVLTFVGTFTASATSVDYRLIFHIGTASTAAWNLQLDDIVVTDDVTTVTTQVPSLVIPLQPISGAVLDHMCVMWRDGSTQWVPATVAGAAIPAFGSDTTQLGFATNIDGNEADIFIQGYMDGFSFGPFAGYDQYIDTTAGFISPLPSPFTDTYVSVGKAITAFALNVQFSVHVDDISNASGTPLKGGLLTNSGVNDGTGDQVLSVGTNGQVPVANSAVSLGIQWAAPIVATTPFTFTLATRTLTIATATDSVAGVMSAADHTSLTADTAARHNAVTIGTANGLSLATQVLSLAAATDSVPGALTAADHTTYTGYAASIALKAPLASPTFTGTPTLPTGAVGVTQTALDSTTKLATTAFVTTASNLKAPLASPVFTGDVNVSTGNLLVSTIGKGIQIKTGANSKIGSVTLVAGTATVANTSVTANSLIFLTAQTTGGTVGFLRITAKTVATSFVVTSSNPLDTSTVAWMIVESIP